MRNTTYRSKGVHTNRDKTAKMSVPAKRKPTTKQRMGAVAKAAGAAQSDAAAYQQAEDAEMQDFRNTAAQMAQNAALNRQSSPGRAQELIKAKKI